MGDTSTSDIKFSKRLSSNLITNVLVLIINFAVGILLMCCGQRLTLLLGSFSVKPSPRRTRLTKDEPIFIRKQNKDTQLSQSFQDLNRVLNQ